MTAREPRAADDRGSFLIITSLALVGLLLVAAIVIDLGYLRSSVRSDQSIVDLTALAAGKGLGSGDYVGACEDAVSYFNTNAKPGTTIAATSFCSQIPVTCTSTTQEATPSATAGRYTLSIHFPVPAAEIADPIFGAGIEDGTPCQRMRVIVSSSEPAFFGGVVGRNGYTGSRSATVRAAPGTSKLVPALWLLDPTGCTSLAVSGGSIVTVGTTSVAGVVTVDSDGTGKCQGSQTTVSSTGSNTRLTALNSNTGEGSINLVATPLGAATCSGSVTHDCDQADVNGGRLSPQPVNGDRATRAPVDWKWNCKTGYPDYHGVKIADCPEAGTTPPYIDQLTTLVTNNTSGNGHVPSGFSLWSSLPGASCNPSGVVIVPQGNWVIDCATGNGLSIGQGTQVTFEGGNVIFDGNLTVSNGGQIYFNDDNTATSLVSTCLPPNNLTLSCLAASSRNAAWVYFRTGGVSVTSGNGGAGKVDFNHSMVYIAPSTNNSDVKLNSSQPPTWLAPSEGPFRSLALWAERVSSGFGIAGGSGVELSGTFFTPEAAPFSLTGGGNWSQQSAQFISFQLAISGGGTLQMAPDPDNSPTIPPRAGVLIR